MIFVTVGTQLGFPRLVDAMDHWAASQPEPVMAQTGETAQGRWQHLDVHPSLSPEAFGAAMKTARLVVGHAGIGTILSAARYARPLIIFPREASRGEHRNDHQRATAQRLEGRAGLSVAWDVRTLTAFLDGADDARAPSDVGSDRAKFLARLAALVSD